MELVSVNANGQVTLPAKLRKQMGIAPGATLQVIERKGVLELKKVTVMEERLLGELEELTKAKNLTAQDLTRICREVRDGMNKGE